MWLSVHLQLFDDELGDFFARMQELEERLRAVPGVAAAEAGKAGWEVDIRYDPERITLEELVGIVRQAGLMAVPDEGAMGHGTPRPFKDFDEEDVYKER